MNSVEKVNSEKIYYSSMNHGTGSNHFEQKSNISYRIFNSPHDLPGKISENKNNHENENKDFHIITKNSRNGDSSTDHIIHDLLKAGCKKILEIGSKISDRYILNNSMLKHRRKNVHFSDN